MRVFVALNIPDARVIDRMVAFQGELSATGADLKLVERQNLHFTVKFLGEISEAQAKEAATRLRALKLTGIEATVKGVGAFPRPSRPSVIWVGVAHDDEARVNPLATSVVKALEGIGESDDRPYQAHITIARVRSGRNKEALESFLMTNSERDFGGVKLASLNLVSSLLTPKGPVYTDLEVYPLE
ncbi:MAG: RNA 2',3'-cyclic phosphodiesterase [Nitrososphaerales archaeon]|nr:RNA 2',3'-cyclic phosphodiesterase [Nitrososphaerales archaeon]